MLAEMLILESLKVLITVSFSLRTDLMFRMQRQNFVMEGDWH
jgi:hypothetical protein